MANSVRVGELVNTPEKAIVHDLVKCSSRKCKTLVQFPMIKCSVCRGLTYNTKSKLARKAREKRLRSRI